ncbi:MAG: methylaspartate mutase subunit E [Alphaproteobacteria bacterium]|nr:methylaspartate mutase subunit E [Alphaproteobacteria bacterium]MDP6566896.1 methylaspartate mutase subunit E [Alphaproteobacteria bacterium]MDP6815394.1 methylaspartate mutase subunit E [Alphaproteobacteria bacterium]
MSNASLAWDGFLAERREVFALNPGSDIELDEALAYLRSLPETKNCARALAAAKAAGETLLQPRAAVPTIEAQIALMRCLAEEGDADILPTQVDSYSRTLDFDQAKAGLEQSLESGQPKLNGFPFVAHGVAGTRQVTEALAKPFCMRQVTPDTRLVAEVAMAGGYTGVTSHAIDGVVSFSKNFSFEESIKCYQYVDRLAAHYQENGAPIYREYRGMVDAVHLPPSLIIATSILEALMGAAQGVKVMGVCSFVCGHMMQEAAGLRVLQQLAEEYLARFGHGDVTVFSVANHWLGQFPEDEARAHALINVATAAAVLGGATEIIVKSVQEGKGIPTKEANAASLRSVRAVLRTFKVQGEVLDRTLLAEEAAIIEMEARALLEKTLELGDGDAAKGTVRAFEAGVLDSLLAPYRGLKGEIMIVRDGHGAMRYLDHGNLPLPAEAIAYNRERLATRAAREGRAPDYEMLVDDINAIAEGGLLP